MMEMLLQIVIRKKIRKTVSLVAFLKVTAKIAGSGSGVGSVSQRYGSADPDPDQYH
jgi:hypothetical protein